MTQHHYVLDINNEEDFNQFALTVFHLQATENEVYKQYLNTLAINHNDINTINDVPFLPIEFFKNHKVITGNHEAEQIFESSGTTGVQTSRHYVNNIDLYEQSFTKCFELFYGKPHEYCFIALLPSYIERGNSSLIYMMDKLIKSSKHSDSGFYKTIDTSFIALLNQLKNEQHTKVFLIGVTYALLELAENYTLDLNNFIVMETGGMKGMRKEITRMELYDILTNSLNVNTIHSEYGMTELLSQAYAVKEGVFRCPPWMRIIIRDANDPFNTAEIGKTGVINVIDMANIYSCSFIATQDAGKLHHDNSFEVLGRVDNSDVRGCNLLLSL